MRNIRVRLSRRFSLRTALTVVTIIVVAFAVRTNQVRRHDRAIAELRARGAIFYRDFEDPIGPNWLWTRSGLGRGALEREGFGWLVNTPLSFAGYRAVLLSKMVLTDDDLTSLADLVDLQQITLEDVPLSDSVIAAIARLPALTAVAITSSDLDDSTAPWLLEFHGTESIWLEAPAISTEGWRRLKVGLGEALHGR